MTATPDLSTVGILVAALVAFAGLMREMLKRYQDDSKLSADAERESAARREDRLMTHLERAQSQSAETTAALKDVANAMNKQANAMNRQAEAIEQLAEKK